MLTPTGAKDLVNMRRTDMFSNGHGDLVLGYGLASNSVWTFETGVDEVDFVGGKPMTPDVETVRVTHPPVRTGKNHLLLVAVGAVALILIVVAVWESISLKSDAKE